MISHQSEISELAATGALDGETAALLGALDRREVMSVHQELRVAAYLAVTTIVTGVGFYLKDNYRQIGTDTLILMIGAAAAACYLFAFSRQKRAVRGLLDEYILLLGGLLLSGDVAFAESQYHLLDGQWSTHLLILAVVHAAGAYFFSSSMLLSLSISSLAGWFGVERNIGSFFSSSAAVGTRALLCAGTLLIWRKINDRGRWREKFDGVFDQFIALLALGGALLWCFDPGWKWPGFAAVMMLSVLGFLFARKSGQISFALYSLLAGYIGFSRMVVDVIGGTGGLEFLLSFYFMASVPAMIIAIILIVRLVDRRAA